jgi:hypothetical protein
MASSLRTSIMKQGDEECLAAFLRRLPEITLLLRSNLHNEGLKDEGRSLQGTWAAEIDESGAAGTG